MRHKRRVRHPHQEHKIRARPGNKRRRITDQRVEDNEEYRDCVLKPAYGQYQRLSPDDIATRWRDQCVQFFKNASAKNVPIDAKVEEWFLDPHKHIKDPRVEYVVGFRRGEGSETKLKVMEIHRFVRLHAFTEILDHEKDMPPHDKKGAPYCLVVTKSAGDAVGTIKRLRHASLPKPAKLFSKHLKLEDTVNHLKTHKVDLGVGTPARLLALTEDGALDVSFLRCIVIGASYIDKKNRAIMDMSETFMPLARWLAHPKIRERMEERPGILCFA
ncbi:U3-containing 90S pre-ribosomal complex subunit-domain containing protein [Hypomontagnella submonticulosa]|nr:U3-containing 90S pre-ribosomal complex subunit-domain containing protein [Hypomontagnella submonticulosa]